MEESIKMLDLIKREFDCKEVDIKTYSPLTLAFLGDCVYDLVIRTALVAKGNRSVESLHKSKSAVVKAATQAAMAEALTEEWTEAEADIYRRGRNAKSFTTAKNAKVTDYRKATGFEAVIGYLYLLGNESRILELTKIGLEKIEVEI